MSFLFRPQRGSLVAAMDEVVELRSLADLAAHLAVPVLTITVRPYGFDHRIEWETHIVTVAKGGRVSVAGFTDGPVT